MASHRRQAIGASCVWQARRAPAEGRTRWQASPRFHQVLDPRLQMGGCRSPDMACLGAAAGVAPIAEVRPRIDRNPQGISERGGVRLKFSLDIISAKVQIGSNRTSRKAFEFPILTLIGTPLSVPRGSSRLWPGERPLRGRIPWAMRTNIARWLCSTIAGPVCADHLNPVKSTFA
jgi:hypothetical protein